ncbi:hypothetical protein YPPY89_3047, partial [Yersinia pestis PY-89]
MAKISAQYRDFIFYKQ